MDAETWFERLTTHRPHPWQEELLAEVSFGSRLIRIPTGFGKTLGVLGAWTLHRVVRRDDAWPRRLVFCLPMRTLVEQTVRSFEAALRRAGLGAGSEGGGVKVHCLMGGAEREPWHPDVEADAVIVGTQDMLLSRALNRGYGCGRARWPIDFGLLHQDVLWVFDEVQLMDVGLATSAQLEAFRLEARARHGALRPAASWWMSATLQPGWLRSVDTAEVIDGLPRSAIPSDARRGHLWDDVRKPLTVHRVAPGAEGRSVSPAELCRRIAARVAEAWRRSGRGRLALVVLNTVDRALGVFAELIRIEEVRHRELDLRLVHSRFRPRERASWLKDFLGREAPMPVAGRIIVATQVVEAGVDLDAGLLVTELAPWPSLVQRFGRAARGGGSAPVLVIDPGFEDDKKAAPYAPEALAGAREALERLDDVAPLSLERFEDAAGPSGRAALYPYEPAHLLLRRELDELFDTTPDLSGADIDVSRFIRSGDERDCAVAWITPDALTAAGRPPANLRPAPEALCPVPFLRAREWLCGRASTHTHLKEGVAAWVWDWLEGEWRRAGRSDLIPGRTVLVRADGGGYDPRTGFAPGNRAAVATVEPRRSPTPEEVADASQDGESLSEAAYKTIATHAEEVVAAVRGLAGLLGLPPRHARALALAARWHDLGKAHPNFQGSMRAEDRPRRRDLAKAPDRAWGGGHRGRDPATGERRRGLRHELASALALFAVLECHRPDHPALLGPRAETSSTSVPPGDGPGPGGAEREILELDDALFDLVAYLVASHHGKVRTSLHAAPADQEYVARDDRGLPVRGIREGDLLPPTRLHPADRELPAWTLTLEPAAMGLSPRTGRSWTERVLRLLDREGVFRLAFLEACLRAADVRAPRLETPDPLLNTPEAS